MEKEPHYIDSKLLDALGGNKKKIKIGQKETELVENGAYLWGVEDTEKGKGIFNHVMLTSRVADTIAQELKNRKISGYENLNMEEVVHAAILHDVAKLHGQDREELSEDQKEILGLPRNFKEISEENDEAGKAWLKELGFGKNVYGTISGHDFPLKIENNPYWKIILLADYMCGQNVMTVGERLADVKKRWIEEKIEKGLQPRIDLKHFEIAEENIKAVAKEIFEALKINDSDFIENNKLNSPTSQKRWEKFLRRWRHKGERVKRYIDHISEKPKEN
jgi:hypothetical protein